MFTVSPYSDPMMVKLHSGMSRHVEDPEMLWVMGPVLAVVLIIIIVIAILLFKRYGSHLLFYTEVQLLYWCISKKNAISHPALRSEAYSSHSA